MAWTAPSHILSGSSSQLLILDAGVGTGERPLYDGTNYTFPDTTKSAGIAELLENTFVNACFQLREGFVDVLKMFVAASIAGYEFGFPIDEIARELDECPNQTANRPLMEEEIKLRRGWYCVVYLTLATLGHPTKTSSIVDSIPDDIRSEFGGVIDWAVETQKKGIAVSNEGLLKQSDTSNLSPMDIAILSQSIRVMTLTFTVLRETQEARAGDIAPPTPPIEGAY
ncbi:unnamed protein product [Cylindrotheca closterium]|uniref:Uncharacterized protein n=1 Tax=Cylindrotheca closterium TaxID=2856 RepID=A0AAD2PW15_9STRA|nr:unnamed protein product [Cylindrotheca closterium]